MTTLRASRTLASTTGAPQLEQKRARSGIASPQLRHRVRGLELSEDLPDEPGLPDAGRTTENHRGQAIGFNRPAQQFAWPENVFLADKFLE